MSSTFLDGYNPIQIPNTKPKKHEPKNPNNIKFAQIKSLSPTFSYRYLSLGSGSLCYNNPNIPVSDFFEMFVIKKELSRLTFDKIKPKKKYHFHYVDLNKKEMKSTLQKLKELIENEIGKKDSYHIPDIYQFAVYTTPEKAPRVFGFLGKEGLFNIIWFDLGHTVYSKKKQKR